MQRLLPLLLVLLFAVLCALEAFAQGELISPKPGPYSLKGSRAWQVGPIPPNQSFTISPDDPFGRTTILCSFTYPSGGTLVLETFIGGVWRRLYYGVGTFSPGVKLPPGTYRFTNSGDTNPVIAYGYMASPTSTTYSGIDHFPEASRLWSFHSLLDNSYEFTVPPVKVYMLTMYHSGNTIERFDGGVWSVYIHGNMPYQLVPPGIRLPAGLYRMPNNGPDNPVWCGGYITTEN